MSDELEDAIEQNATDGIKRVKSDNTEVEAHSIADQIEAAKFAAAQRARRSRRTVRMIRILPPGAV